MLGIGDGGAITQPGCGAVWAAVAAGSVAGETVGYGIGRRFGPKVQASRASDLHRRQNGITPFACLRGTETYDLASCGQFVLVDEAAQDIAPSCGSVNARR